MLSPWLLLVAAIGRRSSRRNWFLLATNSSKTSSSLERSMPDVSPKHSAESRTIEIDLGAHPSALESEADDVVNWRATLNAQVHADLSKGRRDGAFTSGEEHMPARATDSDFLLGRYEDHHKPGSFSCRARSQCDRPA